MGNSVTWVAFVVLLFCAAGLVFHGCVAHRQQQWLEHGACLARCEEVLRTSALAMQGIETCTCVDLKDSTRIIQIQVKGSPQETRTPAQAGYP